MTIAQAKSRLRPIGVTLKKVDGEYIVRHGESTYFTNDIDDAVVTGFLMAKAGSAPTVALDTFCCPDGCRWCVVEA